MNATMRLLAVLTVVLLSLAGIAYVLELIPREDLPELTGKLFAVLSIVGFASLAIGLLMQRGNRNK